YLMWNFSGRQSDRQSHIFNRYTEGNWISGISVLDHFRLGPQAPDNLENGAKEGRNQFYLIPFVLGISGLIFLYRKNKAGFFSSLLLFFVSGILINVFLNQPPLEPRERDYVHAGSFQVFCIWTGLGVLMLFQWFSK